MEEKMTRIPFDIERAKRIQNGEEPGRIVTRHGRKVEIVRWDVKNKLFPIIGVVTIDGEEHCCHFTANGGVSINSISPHDIELEVSLTFQKKQFKDGDLLKMHDGSLMLFREFDKDKNKHYVALKVFDGLLFPPSEDCYFGNSDDIYEHATEGEKQKFMRALMQSNHPFAKVVLEKFFSIEIEEKLKCAFKVGDFLVNGDGEVFIFDGHKNADGYGVILAESGEHVITSSGYGNFQMGTITRRATNEDIKRLISKTHHTELIKKY